MDLVFAPSQIETWPIARLRPYARNAKMHGQDQVAKIAASMARFGWTMPCMVADDGELIAGHGRVLAATMLGLTEVPVIRLSHLDEAERRAIAAADIAQGKFRAELPLTVDSHNPGLFTELQQLFGRRVWNAAS